MFKSNLHTHTRYCDGENTPKEFVEKAIELSFLSLGFSAHSPMTFESEYAVNESDMPKYFEEIEKLKKEYENQIEIYNGIELDYDSIDLSFYKFDYVIASFHQIHSKGKVYALDNTPGELCECVNEVFGGSFNELARYYYGKFVDFIVEIRPDIVGHFDLIEKFNENNRLFKSSDREYQAIVRSAVNEISKKCPGQIFEVNTGAMYRCKNSAPYPSSYIMSLIKENGLRLTVNSDSHCVSSLDFAFDKAIKYCKDCGFNSIWMLKEGSFKEIGI